MAMKDPTPPALLGGGTCSICQAPLRPGEPIRGCDDCGASFHADCWAHNEGCGTYGCKRAPESLQLVVSSSPDASNAGAWGDTKLCPSCGEELIASTLKCPKCKATFETRAPMSPEDYRAQLARKTGERRDTVLAALLLAASALGVPAPVTLPLSGGWAFVKRRSTRRAADVAQLLLYGAFALSLAHVGLMIAIFGAGW